MGDWIKRLRAASKQTQQQFATDLGVSMATVARWESGDAAPSPMARKFLALLAKRRKFAAPMPE